MHLFVWGRGQPRLISVTLDVFYKIKVFYLGFQKIKIMPISLLPSLVGMLASHTLGPGRQNKGFKHVE